MKALAVLVLSAGALAAQIVPNPTQSTRPQGAGGDMPQPIFRVTVTSRTTKAINYHHRTGTTMVDLKGTALMPVSTGVAKVQSNTGATKMTVDLHKMSVPSSFGPEYLTFVLWAVTPEGRANNLGEVVLNGTADHRSIDVATELQAFGLIVTAEPYWGVTQPSDVVVMENFVRNDTTGTIEQVDAKYELLQRGMYEQNLNTAALAPMLNDPKTNLQLREARNAVEIARAVGAERYAGETFQKALIDLKNAEDFNRGKGDKKQLETNAREAVQMSEDARIITLRKIQADTLASERAAAAQREADAQAQAAEAQAKAADEARRRAQSDAERASADQARMKADEARHQAEQAQAAAMAASAQAEKDRAAAEAARAAALAQQQAAQADAEKARLAAQQANSALQQSEAEKVEMRRKLLAQFNAILETRDSARGLIVNMSDVLFDFNQSTLKPGAREKLAKVSGILLAYPGLRVAIEGHTDSIGTDQYNQTLSEKRASNVRDYLVAQGISMNNLSAMGMGKANPVASNDNAAGRQQNRRVEMVVSGEIIGTPIGGVASNQ
jgi:outer membrane protein OmpA-like peptidoglycan-associated protein